jgi:hypothetical protein
MAEDVRPGAPAANGEPPAAPVDGREAVRPETAQPGAGIAGDSRKAVGVVGAVLGPAALITALAFYFGWRRERAFAEYFGIDPTVLGFSRNDYVLRSVDALFVPAAVVLLVVFAVVCLFTLVGDRIGRLNTAPFLAVAGLAAIAVGVAFGAGHPVASSRGYLQALAPAVGVFLVAYALVRWRGRSDGVAAGVVYVATGVALVSLFWATAEYADSRGRSEAARLARNLDVNPTAVVFSKEGLNIDPQAEGSGVFEGCSVLSVSRAKGSGYPYSYAGFTLLIRSGDKYFLTPTPPNGKWDATNDSVFILPDDPNIRVQLTRGSAYHPEKQLEGTASPIQPVMGCH